MNELYLNIATVITFLWWCISIFVVLWISIKAFMCFIDDKDYEALDFLANFCLTGWFCDSDLPPLEIFCVIFFGGLTGLVIGIAWGIILPIIIVCGTAYLIRSIRRLSKKLNKIQEKCKNC